jgi:ADP-ribosyl-[dinitrogen reductase] hydrolase
LEINMNASKPRTSISHPLIINTIAVSQGELGLTFCPGKQQLHAMTGAWHRDTHLDIAAIKSWGASVVVSLLEDHEYAELNVPELPALYAQQFRWFNLPFADKCAPDASWSDNWISIRGEIKKHLASNAKILIHCKGGFGRTGTVAALILMDHGYSAANAIAACRKARKFAVETTSQQEFVCSYRAVGV